MKAIYSLLSLTLLKLCRLLSRQLIFLHMPSCKQYGPRSDCRGLFASMKRYSLKCTWETSRRHFQVVNADVGKVHFYRSLLFVLDKIENKFIYEYVHVSTSAINRVNRFPTFYDNCRLLFHLLIHFDILFNKQCGLSLLRFYSVRLQRNAQPTQIQCHVRKVNFSM